MAKSLLRNKPLQTQPLSLNTSIRVELVSVHSSPLGWDEFLILPMGIRLRPALLRRDFPGRYKSRRWLSQAKPEPGAVQGQVERTRWQLRLCARPATSYRRLRCGCWRRRFALEVHTRPETYVLISVILCWRTPGWYFVLSPKCTNLRFIGNFILVYYFCFRGHWGFLDGFFAALLIVPSSFTSSAGFRSPLQCFVPKLLMKIVDQTDLEILFEGLCYSSYKYNCWRGFFFRFFSHLAIPVFLFHISLPYGSMLNGFVKTKYIELRALYV